MADPRWLDLTMSPNDRGNPGKCFIGVCEDGNNSPLGLARFTTASSFLSQWADGVSQMDGVLHLPHTSLPTLVVVNGADDAVPAEHGEQLYAAIPHNKKEFYLNEGAYHYYINNGPPASLQPQHLKKTAQKFMEFVRKYTEIPMDSLLQPPYTTPTYPSLPVSSTTAPPPLGFSHVALVCSDMAVTTNFYTKVLGFPLVKTISLPGSGQHFFFDVGDRSGGTLAFFWWPSPSPRAPGVATANPLDMKKGREPRSAPGSMNHVAFQYKEEDLLKLRKQIKKAGHFVSPLVYHAENENGYALDPNDSAINMISMYLWGPDGELIEFAATRGEFYPSDVKKRVLHPPKSKL
eukprot:CAMPEP_0201519504 /NCGR_PEP_ID=MMETSP0161_2-20130828/10045_1 /ASSEMBLY_ACC=CAM_ASM_000251 /TAXON_ID=180227 /ORGANISM="Neoparamoeba aestuarina, Strain SoJaBio B1-5/56/2" /LENGTH=347 /DNA_ID=CAMNT_0047917563 /DNA_START=499 /DNA_END=1542 /DNA_ORIENTATION=+